MRPGERPNRPFRVVLDTNVLVSALLWDGNERDILTLCNIRHLRPVTSIEILKELDNVLERTFGLSWGRRQLYKSNILMASKLVAINGDLRIVDDDPTDDKILETAIVGKADFIVTGDKHLLSLEGYQGIRILRAAELVRIIAGR